MPTAVVVVGVVWWTWGLGQGLGAAPLSGTEGHRAITAHQMAASARWQDWAVPRLFGELYLRKPPMHYWVLAVAERLTGVAGEWLWRWPSVLWFSLTAGCVSLFAGRWFGRPADVVAGLGTLTLVALWPSARSADLDALNNLLSVAAACVILDLGFGPASEASRARRAAWSGGLALLLAGMLLTKGPAGLPVVAGAWLGASGTVRRWRWLARPAAWLPVLAAAALAGGWALVAWQAVRSDELSPDLRGLDEAGHNVMHLARSVEALSTVGQLLLFGLPWTLALGWWWSVRRRSDRLDERWRRRLDAAAGTFVAGLLLCLVNGVANPRYGFMLLPMLPLAGGAMASAWARGAVEAGWQRLARQAVTLVAAGAAVASVIVALMHWDSAAADRPALAVAAVLAVAGGAWAVSRLVQHRAAVGSSGTFAALLALSVPLAAVKDQRRLDDSGQAAAVIIAEHVPAGQTIHAGHLLWWKPEILHYTGRPVRILGDMAAGGAGAAALQRTDRPRWIVLDEREWKALQESIRVDEFDVVVPVDLPAWTGVLVHLLPEGK